MPSGRKASLNRFLTQIEGGTGVLCLLSYSPSLGSHQQIQHRQLPPENQATEGKDVLELQGRGPQMERTNRWSARSFQRLQTISSSISSLILLSSTSAGFLLSGKFQLMIQQRIGPGDGINRSIKNHFPFKITSPLPRELFSKFIWILIVITLLSS